ncbi:MAG: DUF3565 domain-containing protein [Hyphomicrobium sp.]
MKQKIDAFEQDDEGHYVALLACGHRQHVRHKPPFIERPWVLDDATRRAMIGEMLDCTLCVPRGHGAV